MGVQHHHSLDSNASETNRRIRWFLSLRCGRLQPTRLPLQYLYERPLAPELRLSVKCSLVRGFPSHDGKCAICIAGQSSAGSVRPCLKCIAKKADFRKYRQWMHAHRPETIDSPVPGDEAVRMGEYSNVNCFERYRLQTGDGMYDKVTIKDKHIGMSVVQDPCARITANKETGGAMHASSGIIDHIIDDCRLALFEIDTKDGAFMQELIRFRQELEAYVGMSPTNEEEQQRFYDKQQAKNIDAARAHLDRLRAKKSPHVEAAKQSIENLLRNRYHYASTSGLGAINKLRMGAQEALDAVVLMLKNKKHSGESKYVFNKAIELTGARFRSEHGGMKLSNAHAIIVAQHYEKVASAVEATYASQPLVRDKVHRIMRTFRRLCEPAYKMAVLLKSQEKLTGVSLIKLKDCVCDLGIAFREEYPDRVPYPKLHWLECCIVPFGELHGFIGLGSEEGFESAHNRLAWIKRLLHSMPFMKDRGIKQGQRYQLSLLPGFDKIWGKLHPAVKERGPYKKKSASEKKSKALQRLNPVSECPMPSFVELPSGSMIYEVW